MSGLTRKIKYSISQILEFVEGRVIMKNVPVSILVDG